MAQELAELQGRLVRALLGGDCAVLGEIVDGARFAIHRNNVFAALIETLRATYPVCERLVGEAFFREAARLFVAAHPPRLPVLAEYGEGFAGFLDEFEPVRELPYLADTARLEWLRNVAFHTPDRVALAASALAVVPAEGVSELVFAFHPSAGLIASPYPIVSIWETNAHDAQVRAIGPDLPGEAALVLRPRLRVLTLRLEPAEHGFVSALMGGRSLLAASGIAPPGFPLAECLARLISAGAICGIRSGSERYV